MDALSEAEVAIRLARQVQHIGAIELLGVAVCRADRGPDEIAFGDRHTGQGDVA